ncbi:Centrosomal protein cep57L1 [Phlyctochytrium planicorne]|nr:Centrosomal protein cep57L1 [Phlyctochytrium planicorne]
MGPPANGQTLHQASILRRDLDSLRRDLDRHTGSAAGLQIGSSLQAKPNFQSFHGSMPAFGRDHPALRQKIPERHPAEVRGRDERSNFQEQPVTQTFPVHSRTVTGTSDYISTITGAGEEDFHNVKSGTGVSEDDLDIQDILSERLDALIDEEIANANRKLSKTDMFEEPRPSGSVLNTTGSVAPDLESARKLYLKIDPPREVSRSRPTLSPDYEYRSASPKNGRSVLSLSSGNDQMRDKYVSIGTDVPEYVLPKNQATVPKQSSPLRSSALPESKESLSSARSSTKPVEEQQPPRTASVRTVNFSSERPQVSSSNVQYQNQSVNIYEQSQKPSLIPTVKPGQVRHLRNLSAFDSMSESFMTTDVSNISPRSNSPYIAGPGSPSKESGSLSPVSLYSNAPDLVGLANPDIKGSRLNLQEQGPAIIPSVVDLAEPVQHVPIGHLPEESNTKAVVNALKSLHDKVESLEQDKQASRQHILNLERDLVETRSLLINEQSRHNQPQSQAQTSQSLRNSIKRNLEDQVSQLQAELIETREALRREHRIVEVSHEAQEIADQLAREAEDKARRMEELFDIKERQMREEIEAVKSASHGESASRDSPVDDTKDESKLHSPTKSVLTQFPSVAELERKISEESTKQPHQSQRDDAGFRKFERQTVESSANTLQAQPASVFSGTRRGDDSFGDGLAGSSFVSERSDAKKSASREEIETQLSYLRNRASNLERQLHQSRGLHQSALAERDLAREELSRLQERIRKRERKLKRLNGVRSRSPSPSLYRRGTSPHRHRDRHHHRAGGRAFQRTVETEDTGAEGDVEAPVVGSEGVTKDAVFAQDESATEALKSLGDDIGSLGYLSERELDFVREENEGKGRGRGRGRASSQPANKPLWNQWRGIDTRIDSSYRTRANSSGRTRANSPTGRHRREVPIGREMPFIIGTNAGKSYSVTANLQKVFSLLKSHNPALCSVCNKRNEADEESEGGSSEDECAGHAAQEYQDRIENLQSILSFLEDEFRTLRSKYNSLVVRYESQARESQLIPGTQTRRTLRTIGDELKDVIQDMNVKGDQVQIMMDVISSTIRHFETYHGSSGSKSSGKAFNAHGGRRRAQSEQPLQRNHLNQQHHHQQYVHGSIFAQSQKQKSKPQKPSSIFWKPVNLPPNSTSYRPKASRVDPSLHNAEVYRKHRSPLSGGGWTHNGEDPRPVSRVGPRGGYIGVLGGTSGKVATTVAAILKGRNTDGEVLEGSKIQQQQQASAASSNLPPRGRSVSSVPSSKASSMSQTADPFRIPAVRRWNAVVDGSDQVSVGSRRGRSRSHTSERGEKLQRARSISPSRAIASLSLLKSSLKVQQALKEV